MPLAMLSTSTETNDLPDSKVEPGYISVSLFNLFAISGCNFKKSKKYDIVSAVDGSILYFFPA